MGIDISRVVDSVMNRGRKSGDTTSTPTFNKFDYYSGSQIGVWFGNVYIDDIQSIQWSRNQAKKPIYGYASQTFDAVATGSVIITGSFVVNFRQSGYMQMVISEISKIYNRLEDKTIWDSMRGIIGNHLKYGTFGPATTQAIIDIGNSKDFIEVAKNYEDVIWGGGVPGDDGKNTTPKRNDPPDVKQSDDLSDGFNIIITYGNLSGNEKTSITDYMQSTTKSINGVHLIGESQTIQVGGQPILEQYDFIARNTDEYVGER